MAKDLKNLCAYELAFLLHKNKIDPINILEYYLENYYKSNRNIKLSYVNILESRAKKEADLAWRRQREGRRKSFFDGIPITWKDMIDLKNYPALAGSKIVSEQRRDSKVKDAKVVTLAKNAGLVSIAKTSTVELAFGGIGTNKFFQLPEIINAKGRFVAGGSSTGAAVAVSHNLAPVSVGTDTAGSIRIPAAWNNLIGFKPSYGIISTKGIIPLSKTYDTVGFLTKSIKDVNLIFNILGKKKYKYEKISFKNIKAVVVKDFILDQLESKQQNKFYHSINKLSENNLDIKYIDIPEFNQLNQFILENGSIVNYNAWKYWNQLLKGNEFKVDPNVLDRLLLGKKMTYKTKSIIEKEIMSLKKQFKKKVIGADVLLIPTVYTGAPAVEEVSYSNAYNLANTKILDNTRVANLFNMCAVSIPLKKSKNNWLSLSILSNSGNEEKLLCIAEKCENIIKKT